MQHSIDFFQSLQMIITLPVLFIISTDILKTISIIHLKSSNCIHRDILGCATLIVCVMSIANTWLKTLEIITNHGTRTDTIIIINKHFKEKTNVKEKTNEDPLAESNKEQWKGSEVDPEESEDETTHTSCNQPDNTGIPVFRFTGVKTPTKA